MIAHVDHGKTSLVDSILHYCKLFRDDEETDELILDTNDLEKERGITILSKNVAVPYKDYKINIIDTPGHADFGGEVERVLKMADGALVLVDAMEGPMPQTKYVLQKALSLGLKPVLVINKVDKPHCRPEEVHEEVFELMFNLGATEEQLDFPVIYGSAKNGWMGADPNKPEEDVSYLMEKILEQVPEPNVQSGTLQLQVTNIDHSPYIGRIAIGRVTRGSVKAGEQVALVHRDQSTSKGKVKELYVFDGLGKAPTQEVHSGDLCAFSGLDQVDIGDTLTDLDNPEGLPPIAIDEPTMSMLFTVNDSPFYGKEGTFVTSRQVKDRLIKETEKNLALKVEETESPEAFQVYGRGILHLSVLVETMRREGYELQVGQPSVLTKEIDGQTHEPVETLYIDVPEDYSSKVIEVVTQRKGELLVMQPKGDVVHQQFTIPSRGLIGLRTLLLHASAGEVVMSHRFSEYQPWKGDIATRHNGSLISMENGTAVAYALSNLQERGKFFISPGDEVYTGQVVGENSRENDMVVNVNKSKKLTNMRSAGADDKTKIAPPVKFSLEEAMEFIQSDEYLEVTPKNLRMRKILLTESERKRAGKKN